MIISKNKNRKGRKRRMKKKLQLLISNVLLLFIAMTSSVFARGVLLTYEGWGIRGKASIHNFTLNDSTHVYLNHTNSNFSYNYLGEDVMQITFQKRNGLGVWNNTGFSTLTYGNATSYYDCTLSAGTYRLYFNTVYSGAVADISGNVTD